MDGEDEVVAPFGTSKGQAKRAICFGNRHEKSSIGLSHCCRRGSVIIVLPERLWRCVSVSVYVLRKQWDVWDCENISFIGTKWYGYILMMVMC